MKLQPAHLSTIAKCSIGVATAWLPHIEDAMAKFHIDTPYRVAGFLSQIVHESGGFMLTEENLNYQAKRLLEVFPKYFTPEQALEYANHPKFIGARVYAHRMGNGSEATGDGYIYRGRGLIQITGKDNYTACGKYFGIDLLKSPDVLKDRHYAALSAGWFWDTQWLNVFADKQDMKAMRKRVNGGLNGLEDCNAIYERALRVLT